VVKVDIVPSINATPSVVAEGDVEAVAAKTDLATAPRRLRGEKAPRFQLDSSPPLIPGELCDV